jgi:hypothetical protein
LQDKRTGHRDERAAVPKSRYRGPAVSLLGNNLPTGMAVAAYGSLLRTKKQNRNNSDMIKSIFTFFAVTSLLAVPAFAKTLKLPSDEFPIASITMPDDWEPEEITNGVAGQSSDRAVYLAAVAVGSEKGMETELDDTFEMLKSHDVELDKSSKKENKFKLNDVEVEELIFHGKDEDGPCSVSISFIPVKDKIVVLTYWVTTSKEEKHQAEVGKIVQSIKPAS